jgi:hypothetical protein
VIPVINKLNAFWEAETANSTDKNSDNQPIYMDLPAAHRQCSKRNHRQIVVHELSNGIAEPDNPLPESRGFDSWTDKSLACSQIGLRFSGSSAPTCLKTLPDEFWHLRTCTGSQQNIARHGGSGKLSGEDRREPS